MLLETAVQTRGNPWVTLANH